MIIVLDTNVLVASGFKPQPITPEEFIRLHLTA